MTYDAKGLGISEMTYFAVRHPVLFVPLYWLIQHGLERISLQIIRRLT
jgi:hypothetical protein